MSKLYFRVIFSGLLLATNASATQPQTYHLRNLKPVGLAQQNNGATNRELLQFQNEQGNQNIVYEESSTTVPLKEIERLAPFLASSNHTCSIDLDCKAKAFCTNDCRSLYYEVSNSPANPALMEKSNCVIKSFSCAAVGSENRAPASLPAAAPVTLLPLPAAPVPPKGN